MIVEFFVEGLPKGQPRPRAFSCGGKARVYDPGTAEHWKQSIAWEAKKHRTPALLDDPIAVKLDFFFNRPKSHRGKNGVKMSAPTNHYQKPDIDNLAKAVLDSMVDVQMFRDDSHVSILLCKKSWGHIPVVNIRIETLTR